MNLVDLDAKEDYTLDGKYSIKVKKIYYWEHTGVIMIDNNKICYGQCGNCHKYVFKDKYCSSCGVELKEK